MRVVLLHSSPGADDDAESFLAAARSFNQGLDIRLRFLDVGFETRAIPVADGDEECAARLSDALRVFSPGVVLVLGRGPRLLECAALAAKEGPPLVFVADGDPGRSGRAIARLAEYLVLHEASPPPAGRPDGVTLRLASDAPWGTALVQTLVRSVRDGRKP